MTIRGTRYLQWEGWTGLKLRQQGRIYSGGLKPMEMDIEKDEGIYIEPNVWMVHEINLKEKWTKLIFATAIDTLAGLSRMLSMAILINLSWQIFATCGKKIGRLCHLEQIARSPK